MTTVFNSPLPCIPSDCRCAINFSPAIRHNHCLSLSPFKAKSGLHLQVETHLLTHAHCLYLIDVEWGSFQNGCHLSSINNSLTAQAKEHSKRIHRHIQPSAILTLRGATSPEGEHSASLSHTSIFLFRQPLLFTAVWLWQYQHQACEADTHRDQDVACRLHKTQHQHQLGLIPKTKYK